MGLYAAGITDETVHNDVSSLGTHLGLAFQLQDDVLDVIADPKELKKPVLSDLEEGQHTYLTSHVRTRGTEEDQAQLDIWFGQSCEGVSQKEVIDFFERTGAISAVQSMITEHMTQAEQYTTSLKSLLSASQFRALTELIDRITHRST
jgi:geranylgeranyl pyrophosphate synthase